MQGENGTITNHIFIGSVVHRTMTLPAIRQTGGQQLTIVTGVVFLVCVFWFPHNLLLHGGGALVGMTIILGRRASNRFTAALSLLAAGIFVAWGIVSQNHKAVGDILYFIGVGLVCCLAISYLWLYFQQRA